MKFKVKNLIAGAKIHRLIVVKLHHQDNLGRKYFLFLCECGNKKVIHGSAVVSGNTKSCGCLSKENHTRRQEEAQRTKTGTKTAIYLGYKRHAHDRKYSFEISKNDFIKLTQKPCFYCGTPPGNIKTTKNDAIGLLYSGVDRMDNTKGYSVSNCVPCCKICNYAKSTLDINQFREWAIKLGKKAMAEQWG